MDHLGYRISILIGIAVCSLSFALAAFAPSPLFFAFAMALFGVGKAFFDSSIRSAYSAVSKAEERSKAFRMRYLVLNVASVVGPLVGALLFPWLSWRVLGLTSFVYASIWAASFFSLKSDESSRVTKPKRIFSSGHRLLFQNKSLLFWVMSTTLVLAVYGGYETLMPLIAGKTSTNVPIISFLFSLNSIVVISVQLLPFSRAHNQNDLRIAQAGFVGLILGFAIFAIFYSSFIGLIVGTILFSIGESLLFPCFETLMDQMAPDDKKASYFAIGEMKQLGFLIGPSIGGLLYDLGGASILFGCFAALCLLSGFAFIKSRTPAVGEF